MNDNNSSEKRGKNTLFQKKNRTWVILKDPARETVHESDDKIEEAINELRFE